MDGVALIRVVREIDPDIKVIVVSGQPEDAVRCRLDGESDIHFLQKPFNLCVLVTMVDEVLAA